MDVPRAHVGPYRLLRPLGAGGMATVFAAVHERMDRRVAVKLLSPAAAGDPQLAARFVQEARALARIDHPGVVRVIGSDTLEDGTAYLVMELLGGASLRAWMLEKPGPIALSDVLPVARRMADAMVAVHAQHIVHRDLKPENVILCAPEGHDVRDSASRAPTIVDFGIAKVPPVAGDEHVDTRVQTIAPAFLGTVTYMAPEQCRNAAEVTERADVYAFGVLLFEMLAGRPPFVAEEAIEVISMHVTSEPPPLQCLAPAVPVRLAVFIASMLAKDPLERPTMIRCRDFLGRPWDMEQEPCPVPGLAPFTEAHAELFFGRRTEIEDLFAALAKARVTSGSAPGTRSVGSDLARPSSGGSARASACRWVQLEGPSGAGKSSLVQAGLLPRLRDAPEDAGRWIIATLRTSDDSLRSLVRALTGAYPGLPFEEAERSLRADPASLSALVTARTPHGTSLLLIVDQLEELLLLGANERRDMDSLLSTALEMPECPLCLLTTVRTDFLHRFDRMPRLSRLLDRATRRQVRAMSGDALTEVVRGMARRVGMKLSDGLTERMIRDAAGEGSRLPLLGHALQRLWSLSRGAPLTHERYEELGGVGGALAHEVSRLLDSFEEEGRERAKWILLDLVLVGRGVPDTRRSRARSQVVTTAGGDRLAEDVLLRLSGMRPGTSADGEHPFRLVALSDERDPSLQRVNLVHETLLRQVPIIAGWIERERGLLERHADLESAAQAWELAGCPADGLPSGSLLQHYRGLSGALARMRGARAARFLEAAEQLERRRRRLRRAATGFLFAIVAVVTGSGLLAIRERRRAESNLQRVVSATLDVVSDADWELSRLPHTLGVRRDLLVRIDRNLRSLPEEERSALEVRSALIRTTQRLGDLARDNETLARADDLLLDADRQIQESLARWPGDQDMMKRLALNCSKRGKVALYRGRNDEARAFFAKSIALLEHLPPGADPEDDQRTLAVSYSEEADLELASGDASAAAQLYGRTSALLERNHGALDGGLGALMLASRGEAARRAGDPEAAEAHLEQALAIGARLSAEHPGNAFFRSILARIQLSRGVLRAARGGLGGASECIGSALALARELRAGEPSHRGHSLLLCEALLADEREALARGDVDHAEGVQRERCALAAEVLRTDGEDVRFQRLACP